MKEGMKILVAYDGSDNAKKALDESIILAEKFKGVLTLEYESWGSKQHGELVQCVEFLNKTGFNLVNNKMIK